MQLKFYACPHCGNQLLFLNRTQPPAPCCCRAMEELHPNTCGSPDVHIPVGHPDRAAAPWWWT